MILDWSVSVHARVSCDFGDLPFPSAASAVDGSQEKFFKGFESANIGGISKQPSIRIRGQSVPLIKQVSAAKGFATKYDVRE